MKTNNTRAIIRWGAIVIFLSISLYLLNHAFFAAWVAGGPPNDYPEAWKYTSLKSLSLAASSALIGIISFLSIRKNVGSSKTTITLLILVVFVLLLFPTGYKYFKIDSCLDSGGEWEYETFKCLK